MKNECDDDDVDQEEVQSNEEQLLEVVVISTIPGRTLDDDCTQSLGTSRELKRSREEFFLV